jgi:peptidoglycan/LPS O-acetylase OafA/YrhL
VGERDFVTKAFLIRRYVRLLIPLAVIVPLGASLGVNYSPYGGWVTWSLVCELAYYTVYPFVRKLFGSVRWFWILGVTYGVGFVSVWVSQRYASVIGLMYIRDIVSNFPAWLFGCYLAETLFQPAQQTLKLFGSLFLWRTLAFAGSFVVGFAHYQHILNQKWSLMFYAMLVTAWLLAELKRNARVGRLANLGSWSYSLYLVHPFAYFGVARALMPYDGSLRSLVLGLSISLVLSYLFYLAVEKPSHRLARALGNRFAKQQAVAMRLEP